MLDEFYCIKCGRHKSKEVMSDLKVGKYKKSPICISCKDKSVENARISNNPNALSGFKTITLKHAKTARTNNSRKSYKTDRLYNYMKDANLL
jgi:hypothetical protein